MLLTSVIEVCSLLESFMIFKAEDQLKNLRCFEVAVVFLRDVMMLELPVQYCSSTANLA